MKLDTLIFMFGFVRTDRAFPELMSVSGSDLGFWHNSCQKKMKLIELNRLS